MPAERADRIVELEASVDSRFHSIAAWSAARGDDNEIKQILRDEDDVAERREAWEASKTVGAAVADDVRELARLRNEAARSLGYRDWFALSVATSEMDEARLFATLDEGDRATARAVRALEGRDSTSASPRASAARCPSCGPGTTPTRSSRRCRTTAA